MLSDKINIFPIIRADHPSIKSFDEQNTVISINKQGNILSFEHSRRNSGGAVNGDRPETSTGLHGKPIAYNLKNVTEELENRRAELAALARAAEARAKEAEERCMQAESILERELNQRLLAEQRLRGLEDDRLRQIQAPPVGAPQARIPTPYVETGVWLKEPERRAKEAHTEIEPLTLALMEAEQKRVKAEALAQAASDKARELESEARITLAGANRKLTEADAAARAAEEKVHTLESLLVEAEASGRQVTERYQTIEAELQREIKQRALAEQKLKEFEDELSSYLELNWAKDEPDMALVGVAQESGGPNELVSQLQAQVGAERRARQEAENARAALELKMREMERALHIAEENNRQIASLNLVKSADDDQTYTIKKRKGFKYELKFIVYGMTIALLLVALFALIGVGFLQM
jgi:hypothetical protein